MTTEISNLVFSVNNQIATLMKLTLQHGDEMPEIRKQTEHQISTLRKLAAMASNPSKTVVLS